MSWRHALLPTLRKQTRDNLGLIISVLAALFAGWAGYEQHRAVAAQIAATKLSDEAARKTIQLAQAGVDAQVRATQLDERPYMNVVPADPAVYYSALGQRRDRFFEAKLKLIVSGRTPALSIKIDYVCDVWGPPGFSYSEEEKARPVAPLLTAGETDFSFCSGIIDDQNPNSLILGVIIYTDYFKLSHKTTFCYSGQLRIVDPQRPSSRQRGTPYEFVPCPNYIATFE
jgi:hypothetical protein